MGYALAEAARALGAQTILVSGPTSIDAPHGVEVEAVETTQEMFDAVRSRFSSCDILIMAAAPADYRPARTAKNKIKKADSELELSLEPTVDILKSLKKKKRQIVVGFALETENGIANARKKLKDKNLDLIVLNSPNDRDSAFDSDTNRVTIIAPGRKPEPLKLLDKHAVSLFLLDRIASML
jgi:phosphopantothenoylcysteine decarboxylase/phosphopantothenate--cysteine ligase